MEKPCNCKILFIKDRQLQCICFSHFVTDGFSDISKTGEFVTLQSYIIKFGVSVCLFVSWSGIGSKTMRTTVMKLLQVIQWV